MKEINVAQVQNPLLKKNIKTKKLAKGGKIGNSHVRKLAWSHKIENAYKNLVCFEYYFVLRDLGTQHQYVFFMTKTFYDYVLI